MRKKLERLFQTHEATCAVIGLGYVGLPLALEIARSGLRVIGIDISEKKAKQISAGHSDIDDVSDDELSEVLASGRFKATSRFSLLKEADCITICVPTPLNKTKDPDVSFILEATEQIKSHLRRGQLVVLESTTYPGTTDELIKPILESTGLKAGKDFFLAYSPERVDPGNARFATKNTPKIVGGIDAASTRLAEIFYQQFIDNVVPVSSTQSAEMVKLLENTFRSVNIALVNEVALMCDRLGIDVWEVIDAAATKPFGYMPFYPGPGLGGHCIPIDPHYLSWKLRSLNYYARFIELAGDINSRMPEYVVEKIGSALNRHGKSIRGSRILILGMAYKRDISDVRESPAIDVFNLLMQKKAKVMYNDPLVPEVQVDSGMARSVNLTGRVLQSADISVILTDHSCYDYKKIVAESKLVMDTRNATREVKRGRKKIVLL